MLRPFPYGKDGLRGPVSYFQRTQTRKNRVSGLPHLTYDADEERKEKEDVEVISSAEASGINRLLISYYSAERMEVSRTSGLVSVGCRG